MRLCLSVLPLNCFFHALDWTVLEPACVDGNSLAARSHARSFTNLCSSHSTASPSTLCIRVQFVSLVCPVRLHFVKSFLPFLAVVFTPSFLLVLAFVLAKLASALVFVLLALALVRACLCLCRPCQTIHSFEFFSCIQFSFDNLSPCGRKFHTMNSFLGTFDLDCLRNRLCVSSC